MKKKFSYFTIIFSLFFLTLVVYAPLRHKAGHFLIDLSKTPLRILSGTGKKTDNMLSFIVNISNLKRQNNDLSSKIISLEVDRSRIAELENENKLLKNELGFAEKNKDYNLMPATIVGREPTSFLDYVIVDKGEQDGTKKGMGVISGGVLVGQISEVYANQSKITLITSKDSLILAMLQNSRAKGILRGGIAGLSLEDIAQDVNFDPKEYVVTSGLDGQLKPGILIGTANGIQSSSSDLFKNISVEPIADLSNLELVFIIK